MNDITETVTAAFEAEEKQASEPVVETPADTPKEEPKQESPSEPVADQPQAEAPAAEEPKAEKTEEEPAPKASAPRQLKGDYVKSHWETVDKDTQDELIRLASENERTFARAAEAEHNIKTFRKTLEPVQGYISETAQMSNITEAEVVRNCVNLIQALDDNPTLTARQMIAGGLIKFDDPVSVVNEIAKTYGLDLKGDLKEADIPVSMRVDAARARYDARQAKFVKPEQPDANAESIITEYVENTPGIKALLDDDTIKDKFIRQIQMERAADPTSSDIAIINRAAELFEYRVAPQAIPTKEPEAPQPTLAEQKMAKVVAPQASNPVSQAPTKREPLTPEQSVRETLRAMGLDD